jgi:Ca2+/Na+ antiporter
MRNSTGLPIVALLATVVLVIVVLASRGTGDGPLTELQLGAVAGAMTLTIYAVQGLLSIVIEGQQLEPGRMPPRLTDPLSLAIVVASVALFGIAVLLAHALTNDWSPSRLGGIAGAGCLLRALLLIMYKEAFVGDESTLDERDDGIPW